MASADEIEYGQVTESPIGVFLGKSTSMTFLSTSYGYKPLKGDVRLFRVILLVM